MFNRSILLPFADYFCDLPEGRLHYFDEGPRDSSLSPVLLLHGNPTWAFYYRELIRALRPERRVIALDFLGCGLSSRTTRQFHAAERGNHLEQFISSLGLEKFCLVMHDWGGPIGTSYAIRHQKKKKKIVYFNTTLTEIQSLPSFIRMAASPVLGPLTTKYTDQFIRWMLRFGVCRNLPTEIKEGYLFPYRTVKDRSAIWDFVKDIPFDVNHPTYSELLRVGSGLSNLRDTPVLIFWGLQDPCFHPGMLRQVAAYFPQAEVVEVKEASHLVLEDVPERACDKVKEFLSASKMPVASVTDTQVSRPLPQVRTIVTLLEETVRTRAMENACVEVEAPGAIERFLKGSSVGEVTYRPVNYGELLSRVYQYGRGLGELGLQQGDKVLMLTTPGADFLALSYAIISRGAIPVFLDPGMGMENLCRCIADMRPDGFIGNSKAFLLRFMKRALFSSCKFTLCTSDLPGTGVPSLQFLKRFSAAAGEGGNPSADEPALIAFTSGGTGTPKGVLFTHAMLEAQLEIFRRQFELQEGGRDLPLLPIFSLFTLPLGVSSIFAPLDPSKPLSFSPSIIARIINEQKITSSFGSPTIWNKIAEECLIRQTVLLTPRQIFMAGAPVPLSVLEKVKKVCPNARISTPYGATEALPVTLVHSEEVALLTARSRDGEEGTPVGKPVDGVSVRIVREQNEIIPCMDETESCEVGEIGEILVKGKNVSPAYLNRPDANKKGKVSDGEEFWHRMGDVGYFGEDGTLYFCGRMTHALTFEGRRFYSDPIERIFNAHPKVRRTALIKIHSTGEPALAVEPKPEFFPKNDAERNEFSRSLGELAAKSMYAAFIRRFFFHPAFPVDGRHNAKIFRDKLSDWASEMLSRAA